MNKKTRLIVGALSIAAIVLSLGFLREVGLVMGILGLIYSVFERKINELVRKILKEGSDAGNNSAGTNTP